MIEGDWITFVFFGWNGPRALCGQTRKGVIPDVFIPVPEREGVDWIRGSFPPTSPEARVLLAAYALSTG